MATPSLTRSAKLYQKRRQPEHRTTRRQPGPHHDFSLNAAHRLELHPPAPLTSVQRAEDAMPPETGGTKVWPWGEEVL